MVLPQTVHWQRADEDYYARALERTNILTSKDNGIHELCKSAQVNNLDSSSSDNWHCSEEHQPFLIQCWGCSRCPLIIYQYRVLNGSLKSWDGYRISQRSWFVTTINLINFNRWPPSQCRHWHRTTTEWGNPSTPCSEKLISSSRMIFEFFVNRFALPLLGES